MFRWWNRTVIRSRSEHNISRRDIAPEALQVLYRLSESGHTAYLVGGGVRDLLLGRQPKDFDVGTSAHPNEIRRLFRNCFLIGRRFRLAHIRFGERVIETSTFRRQPEPVDATDEEEQSLYQERDNTFGSPEEDAKRRDFTINGLFYDIKTFNVIDHVGGLADLKKGIVRAIGDPDVRFQEDPVRMLRAVRFAARLGFEIERKTRKAILRQHTELAKASLPRLLEELYRLFAFRSGASALRLLWETGLLAQLLPEVAAYVNAHGREHDVLWKYLEGLDAEPQEAVTPPAAIIFATLLYAPFLNAVEQGLKGREPVNTYEVARQLIDPLAVRFRMPKREFFRVIHLLGVQERFAEVREGRPLKPRFTQNEIFSDAARLYHIHLFATGQLPGASEPWLELARNPDRRPARHTERPRRTGAALAADAPQTEDPVPAEAGGEGSAEGGARRRRRRPRRRGGRQRTPEADGQGGPAAPDGQTA